MKLAPLTYWIMGLAIFAIAVSYGLFYWYLPNMDQAARYNAWKEQLIAEENKMPAAKKLVDDTKEFVIETSDKWQQVVDRKTPPSEVGAGGINLAANRLQLTVDAMKFRNNVQRAVNAQMKRGGVTVISGPYVPEPSDNPNTILTEYFNYPGTNYPVAIYDLGAVTVRGSWAQISQHVRSWSDMPRFLAVTDGLTISGTSPELTATYNVTVVAFIRGKQIAPAIQLASAPGAAGAPGGAPAGPAGFGAPPAGAPGPGGAPSGAAMTVPGKSR